MAKRSVDSAGDLASPWLELVDQGIIEGANGQALATMEYFDHELHYVGFFAVGHGKAAIVTLTTSPEQFESIRAEVVPYLVTLTLHRPRLDR